jgi:hypothetical protein
MFVGGVDGTVPLSLNKTPFGKALSEECVPESASLFKMCTNPIFTFMQTHYPTKNPVAANGPPPLLFPSRGLVRFSPCPLV